MQDFDQSALIGDYQASLVEIAQREGIIALSQYKECLFDGKHALELLQLADPVRQALKAKGSNDFDWIMDDLINDASPDIAFSLKNAYLYQPGINDFTQMQPMGEQRSPTYMQTMEDKRYLYFCGVALEKIYAFWDRIGDILNIVFDLGFRVDKVYFDGVVSRLVGERTGSENLDWLNGFKEGAYKGFGVKRHDVVHHRGLQSYFRKQHILGVSQKESLEYWEKLQREKQEYAGYLNNQRSLTIEGFSKTVYLIAEKSVLIP